MNANAEIALTALDMLRYCREDELVCKQVFFRQFTPEQMEQQFGKSGKTRNQIVEEYQARIDQVDAAIAWVKAVGA